MYTLQDYEDDVANNEDRPVTAIDVRRELELHDAGWAEFVAEFGEHVEYSAREVLGWLGY